MKISVVIPCRNEVKFIEECIRAIYACDLPKDAQLSVFVVDGMSDDGTREVIEKLEKEFNSLKLIDNQKRLTPFAFNLGIHADPNYDYIQIIGARHIVSKNYIIRAWEKLQENDVWCVGGRIINEFTNSTSELISNAMSTSFGMGVGNFRTLEKSGFTDTVTSPMYSKEVFDKIGYFDEDLIRNQDDDFNYRLVQAGGKIWYEHDISLRYYVRADYKGLWRQFFQYGYWKVFVNKKHKSVTTLRQLAPPIFVLYFTSLVLACSLVPNIWTMLYSIPYLFYAILMVVFAARGSKSLDDFFKLEIIYFILHFGYGLGYLKGIVHFLILNKKPSRNQTRLSR